MGYILCGRGERGTFGHTKSTCTRSHPELGSQVASGRASTEVRDHSGIPGAECFFGWEGNLVVKVRGRGEWLGGWMVGGMVWMGIRGTVLCNGYGNGYGNGYANGCE